MTEQEEKCYNILSISIMQTCDEGMPIWIAVCDSCMADTKPEARHESSHHYPAGAFDGGKTEEAVGSYSRKLQERIKERYLDGEKRGIIEIRGTA